ncbi:unnamed protein product [Staurois parvus]|uniref:Metalloendopeptidase n=1 Tax=Staurois parvus TaxID=386267 RepID=A0ABN9H2X9_9NEOB|nr:unnamed protein product [Staurois parvus]
MPMHGGDIRVRTGRSAINCTSCLWPKIADGTVPVPYSISSDFSPSEINTIRNAMDEFETLTCVRFVSRKTEDNYLNITDTDGCSSFVGKMGGSQTVSLGDDCVHRGIVQHELDHALGFYHEHTRSDRDNYIDINFQYISQEFWSNFYKQDTNNLGLEYDYDSVMHYNRYELSNTPNQATIVPKPNPNMPIGQKIGLSILDVAKINRLYECSVCATLLNKPTGIFTSGNYPFTYPNNNNCVWLIRTPYGQASLTFSGFDVQFTPNCTFYFMRIYDGNSKNSPVLLDKMCGTKTIPPLIASANEMLVEFVSDGAVTGVGFNATYSSVQCGGTFYTFQGNFTSPGYAGNYSPNMNCNYTITAPVGYKVIQATLTCLSPYTLLSDSLILKRIHTKL